MSNAFVDSGMIQITPNYPPYALKLVMNRGGYAVSTGEIGHAFTYSPHVDGIEAVEINSDLVRFYSELQEAIKQKGFREFEKHIRELAEIFSGDKLNGHPVSAGPSFYLPFLISEEEYRIVRDNIGKVSIRHGDCTRFFAETTTHYSTALLNNVPAYVEDWSTLFRSLPLEKEGIVAFGTDANASVYAQGNRIHPGVLRANFGFVSPGEDWQKISVRKAMEKLGYSPVEVPVVRKVNAKDGELAFETARSKGGKAAVFVKSSYPQKFLQSWHDLHTFQRTA